MKIKILKTIKILVYLLLTIGLLYLGLLLFPNIIFAYKVEYKNCVVFSDRPIDNNIKTILDTAFSRVSKSDLYDKNQHFKILVCNDLWRYSFFTQGNTNAGAVTQYSLTRDVFFRPCDITNNKIIPPKEWLFAMTDRDLTYYFAHEMTHSVQSNFTGRLGCYQYPTWLTEGYADYVAKAGNFDFNGNLKMLHNKAPELDPKQGLYRYYHLLVAYLIDKKGMTIKEIYENTPNELTLKTEILNLKIDE